MAIPFTGGKYFDIRAVGLTPGAALYTYAAGTLTPQASYTDEDGLSSNTNPVILSQYGQADVWMGDLSYRFRLYSDRIENGGTLIDDTDHITPPTISIAAVYADFANGTDTDKGAALIGSKGRTVAQRLDDTINVKDYGALGDGTGRTPADDGVDITVLPWNTWTGLPFQTNLAYSPYATGGPFVAPTATPFTNNDTWDYIGIQRAVNAATAASVVRIPAGTYLINMTNARGFIGSGVMWMKGQEISFIGEGKYHTTIRPKEVASFFAANNPGVQNFYTLFNGYRCGGVPSNINDIGFVGPASYSQANKNLCGVRCSNVNGVTITNCWISSMCDATAWDTSCSDNFIQGVTTEFCFGASVRQDASSMVTVNGNNFWASANVAGQYGMISTGTINAMNNNFIGFWGGAVTALSGKFEDNTVITTGGDGPYVTINSSAIIVGNSITGSPNNSMVQVIRDSIVAGNYFNSSSTHACLNIGDGTNVNSATNLTITGNQFVQQSADTGVQNYAITAAAAGTYTSAASNGVIIIGNSFQGRTQLPLGNAGMRDNAINGAMQINTYNQAVVLAGGTAIPGLTTYANDAAAATGGVAVGGVYRNGSVLMVRVA